MFVPSRYGVRRARANRAVVDGAAHNLTDLRYDGPVIRARTRIVVALVGALVASSCGLVMGSQGASDIAHRDLGPQLEQPDAANPFGGATGDDPNAPKLDEDGNPITTTTELGATTTTGPNGELPLGPTDTIKVGTNRDGSPIFAPGTTSTIPVPRTTSVPPPDILYPVLPPLLDKPTGLDSFCAASIELTNVFLTLIARQPLEVVSAQSAAAVTTAYNELERLRPFEFIAQFTRLRVAINRWALAVVGTFAFESKAVLRRFLIDNGADLQVITDRCFQGVPVSGDEEAP